MTPEYLYKVDVRRYLAETGELNSKGNPILIPIIVRKMFLIPRDVRRSGKAQYRVFRRSRYGTITYYVSKQHYITELWPMPKLRPDPPPKWKRVDKFDEVDCLKWVTAMVGVDGIVAMYELNYAEPMNLKH